MQTILDRYLTKHTYHYSLTYTGPLTRYIHSTADKVLDDHLDNLSTRKANDYLFFINRFPYALLPFVFSMIY